ncbi:MAG: glucans biosynthesis glucosyltransferase MdoH [Pseudomonadota bacterium]|jgi:Membrane glycosyltransferase|nr:MAG: glucans biosynthesis glucosyltransferase MdoH [Pseudomonadota bacterium]
MDVPVESLSRYAAVRRTAALRRALFFGLTLLTGLFGAVLMFEILRANGLTLPEACGLVLFLGLFSWIAGAFWTAVAGFVIRLARIRDPAIMSAAEVKGRVPRGRTALVMPIYNEDTARVAAGVDAIWRSLSTQRGAERFDFFILSDTRDERIARAEEAMWRALVARHGAQGRIFYRRRVQNVGRKAGNIADFVRNWGAAYDYMVVLDADSIMTGEALVALACLMDAHPRAGIIQTVPLPAGRETLFARMVQFASRLNSPMLASGLAFWQLGEGNYWGHNAIIRIRPFASDCALPHLPGKPPLGGEILSHDFVEAAFMRRAGYEVWLVPDLEGSWEEVPSNVIDFAARDRRWCQGNLQHARVLPMCGLHWLSRVHMLTGIMAYVSSPLWLVILLLSSIIACWEAVRGYSYFEPGTFMLFPNWPESRVEEIFSLLAITIVLLLLPKALGVTLALVDGRMRRAFGGAGRLLTSALCEQLFSMLLAPAMMVFHSTFVWQTLTGRPVVWNAQARGDRGVTLRESFARHGGHVALGVAWGAVLAMLAPRFLWWMAPVLAGLLASAWLTSLSSRADLGRRARAAGLLLTPEESTPPAELAQLETPAIDAAVAEAGDVPDHVSVPAAAPLRMEPAQPAYWDLRSLLTRRPRVATGTVSVQ